MSKTFNPDETLSQIKEEQFPIIMVPFFGVMVPVKVRRLTEAQTTACGNISLIETFEDKIRKKKSKHNIREILAYANRMKKIVELSLVSPSYKQVIEQIGHSPKKIKEYEDILKELKQKLKSTPQGRERKMLEEEAASIELQLDFLLPEEFMSTIVSFSLRVNDTDIKLLTKDMLLEAAVLAERGHDNPHNHIGGVFTAFNEKDIDKRAWYYLEEERKKK